MSIIALKKMQLQWRERKQLNVTQLPDLLKRMSKLLEEGYAFPHCIEMLVPYHVKNYQSMEEYVQAVLKGGGGPVQIMEIFGLDKQYLVAIQLAEITGNLSETLRQVAEQLHFHTEMKKKLIKVVSYPVALFIFLIALFIAFRTYFLPNMSSMVSSRAQGEETSSIQWATFFLHMPDYFLVLLFLLMLALFSVWQYIQRKRIDLQLNILFKIPLIGHFWRLLLTRQFARSLGSLLQTGFSLQQALDYLKVQHHQKQLAYVAERVQQRVIYGDSLQASVVLLGYFYPRFQQFVAHGEASGLLGRELMLYSELLDERIQAIIQIILAIIQPLMFIVIAVCVIAAYLSILIPMYNLLEFV